MRKRFVLVPLVGSLIVATLLAGCGDDGDTDASLATPLETTSAPGGPPDGPGTTTPTSASPSPSTTPTSAAATSTTTTTTATTAATGVRVEVEVVDGQVVGGPGRVEVPLGVPVELAVTTDVAEEVHVHGYDLITETSPDGVATLSFTADIPGVFEVELEGTHLLIATLVVS